MGDIEDSRSPFGDPRRLVKIDKLMELGVGEYIELPQLVVVGDQSSGKSSVLEGLTGLPFPRDSTLCTRFATQIVFCRAEIESIQVSIIPSASCDRDTQARLKGFKRTCTDEFTATEFADVLNKASVEMGLAQPGEDRAGKPSFSEHTFRVELKGPNNSHFSVVDVPGIFRNHQEGVTKKADIKLVQNMVRNYVKNQRSIILAVVPANVDMATQDILKIAEDVDPHGQRTLGVLTKLDIVDDGAEQDVIDIVLGKKYKLKLGYFAVRNRKHSEKTLSTEERHQNEKIFFNSGRFAKLPKDHVGIEALRQRLLDVLNGITQREFPKVRREITQRIKTCEDELKGLGPSRESSDEQRRYLLELSVEYQKQVTRVFEARYGDSKLYDDRSMRLATRIVSQNEEFAENIEKHGQTVSFEDGMKHKPKLQTITKPKDVRTSDDDPEEATGAGFQHEDFENSNEAEGILMSHEDLHNVLLDVDGQREHSSLDILSWIKAEYNESRGFELGTFDPAVLPLLFREQTRNWEIIAAEYINEVIFDVHRYCATVLKQLCPETRIRAALWSTILDEQLKIYRKTTGHVKFILHTERQGNLLTMNHYFNENLEKSRASRLKSTVEGVVKVVKDEHGSHFRADDKLISGETGMSNLQHVVRDIHDILCAYYKVARKRFVDNVCMQATDYHLVSGPETPLRVFSPTFVGGLSVEKLQYIAGEEVASVQRRRELERQIESLKEGKKELAM